MTSHGPTDRVPAPEAKLPLGGAKYIEIKGEGEVVWPASAFEKSDLAKLTDEVAGLKEGVNALLSAIGRAAESEAVTRHQLMKVMEAHRQATIAQTQAMRGGQR